MNKSLLPLAADGTNYVPANAQPAAPPAEVVPVNMNEVVQHHLISRRQQVEEVQAIIRFDTLPHVLAGRQALSKVVAHIFHSILAHPPAGTRLFIYIRCEKEQTEVMELSLPEGFQRYAISVYTNVVANEAWQQVQQPILNEMQMLVEGANGTFASYRIAKTGCLYQLVLPGKLL